MLPRIHLFRYIKGIFINPIIHLIVVCPTINDQIGLTPKNANGIKIRESMASAGIELKTFLVHKYFPLVVFLNQAKIIASKFSLIRKAIQLATVIRGTNENISFQVFCKVQNGAGGKILPIQKNKTIATWQIKAIKIIL